VSGLPSWFTSITLGSIVGTLLAFGATLGALWLMTRPMRTTAKTIEQLREDWFGVPGRPGFPAIPGVPERLAMLEECAREDRALLQRIDHELHPNSGGSLRDQVNKTRDDVDALRRNVDQRVGEIPRLAADVAAVTRALSNPRTLQALSRRMDRNLDGQQDDEDQARGA
jgi:hypothetical protein